MIILRCKYTNNNGNKRSFIFFLIEKDLYRWFSKSGMNSFRKEVDTHYYFENAKIGESYTFSSNCLNISLLSRMYLFAKVTYTYTGTKQLVLFSF